MESLLDDLRMQVLEAQAAQDAEVSKSRKAMVMPPFPFPLLSSPLFFFSLWSSSSGPLLRRRGTVLSSAAAAAA